MDLHTLSAIEVAASTRSGALRVEDYIAALLAHIGSDTIHAWAHIDAERALADARALDALPADQRGVLHGVALAVKDIVDVDGMPTRCGSKVQAVWGVAGRDAPVVAAFKAAGAVVLGKTHTTEFAISHTGPDTVNPHDATRSPGGSSSGSAAAVAAMHVPLAIGTQTGGSVIRPASFCGVWGLKTTGGAVSRDGVSTYSATCDSVGWFARTPDDLELAATVQGLVPANADSHSRLESSSARIGLVLPPNWAEAGAGARHAMHTARNALVAAGIAVEDITLPAEYGPMVDYHRAITTSEAATSLWAIHAARDEGQLDKVTAETISYGRTVSRADLLSAFDATAVLRPHMDSIARKYDALLAPSALDEAPVLGPERWTGSANFNAMWSALHVPVVNVPGIAGPHGMPVGVSVIAERYGEAKALKAARLVGRVLARRG